MQEAVSLDAAAPVRRRLRLLAARARAAAPTLTEAACAVASALLLLLACAAGIAEQAPEQRLVARGQLTDEPGQHRVPVRFAFQDLVRRGR